MTREEIKEKIKDHLRAITKIYVRQGLEGISKDKNKLMKEHHEKIKTYQDELKKTRNNCDCLECTGNQYPF